jgi:hypothetical protein
MVDILNKALNRTKSKNIGLEDIKMMEMNSLGKVLKWIFCEKQDKF